jgi:hypothetical protein
MQTSLSQQKFCGRAFSAAEVSLIREVVDTYGGISLNEPANTVCELLDRNRFHSGCYLSANRIKLGQTSGCGRMDRTHQRHGAAVKPLRVYRLVKNAVKRLKDGR